MKIVVHDNNYFMEAIITPSLLDSHSGQNPIDVHTEGPQATGSPTQVTKVIIAVHGVGDQHNFGTLQSVVNRFCGFYKTPSAVPLGSFHTGESSYSLASPYPPKPFQELAFAEVYWAPIPREVVTNRYTLEEAKNWTRTIVERMRMRQKQLIKEQEIDLPPNECAAIDTSFERIKFIMTELIESLAVVERLCYVADRAGLFSFNLRKLLEDYLGDVQVVAEFQSQRTKILEAFHEVLTKVHTQYPEADIHFVAHSEGTVVTLLGLLEAINNPKNKKWIYQVRGLMTLGSPIDKHLALWPDLFPWKAPTVEIEEPMVRKIQWRNYYDYGDPIGFELDDVRNKIEKYKLNSFFDFSSEHDMGFARYAFPGKAHVDYWEDEQVFGHFIHTVVNQGTTDIEKHDRFNLPPQNKKITQFLSNVVPYLGLLTLLFGAVYVVFKALISYFPHVKNDELYESNAFIFWSVLGGTCIMSGFTILACLPRMFRLQESKRLHAGAWLSCLAGLGLGWLLMSHQFGKPALNHNWLDDRAGMAYVAWFLLGAILIYWASVKQPTWGTKPLLVLGLLTILLVLVIGTQVVYIPEKHGLGPLWPVFLATAGCLYLWWLTALLFDLVCIWHVSIRQSSCAKQIKELVAPTPLQPTAVAEKPATVPELVGERQKSLSVNMP